MYLIDRGWKLHEIDDLPIYEAKRIHSALLTGLYGPLHTYHQAHINSLYMVSLENLLLSRWGAKRSRPAPKLSELFPAVSLIMHESSIERENPTMGKMLNFMKSVGKLTPNTQKLMEEQ